MTQRPPSEIPAGPSAGHADSPRQESPAPETSPAPTIPTGIMPASAPPG